MKLLAELDTSKGVGLIERVRQGQGKPARIYVLRFTTQELPPQQVGIFDVLRPVKPTQS